MIQHSGLGSDGAVDIPRLSLPVDQRQHGLVGIAWPVRGRRVKILSAIKNGQRRAVALIQRQCFRLCCVKGNVNLNAAFVYNMKLKLNDLPFSESDTTKKKQFTLT